MNLTITVENLSLHPLQGAVLRWYLRGAVSGTRELGNLDGRTTPFGGFVHSVQSAKTVVVEDYRHKLPGVDTIILDYRGESGAMTWRKQFEEEYAELPDQGTYRDGTPVRNVALKRRDQSDQPIW